MHLFYNTLNRKSIQINHQILHAIGTTKNKKLDCQKRLISDNEIKEMLLQDSNQSDDQHKFDYFKKQIIGINRSIRIRKRRIKKYDKEIAELKAALDKVNHKQNIN